MAALAAWIRAGSGEPETRAMSGQELLDGSEFQVATAASEGRGVLTVWGQGAYGRFAGQDDDLAVHGEVASATLAPDIPAGLLLVANCDLIRIRRVGRRRSWQQVGYSRAT